MDHGPRDSQQDLDVRRVATEQQARVEARVRNTVDGVKSTADAAMESMKQVYATVEGARAAFEELIEDVNVALKEVVEGVHTATELIDPEQLQQNPWIVVKTTAELIDPAHVNQHPWGLMGSAILMGYLLGTLERGTASSPGQGASSAVRQERLGT